MKRPIAYFSLAGALSLTALAVGFHRHQTAPVFVPEPPPLPVPVVIEQPKPPEPPPVVAPGNGSLTMVAHLSDPVVALGEPRDEYLKIDITGMTTDDQRRAAVNLAVVLDRSGSMAGDKLENARRAAHVLVDRLNDSDRLAFVDFGSNVELLFPSMPGTSANRAEMHKKIDKLYDMGGTNISGGLELGRAQVLAHSREYPVNRVLLISDGEANEGITSKEGLLALSRNALKSGVSVTALGVGTDFDEDVMEQLAENGGGNYRFLQSGGEFEGVFNGELKQLGTLVASSPRLKVKLAQGVRVTEVFGYAYETAADGSPVITLSDVAAGEHRKVMLKVQVPASAVGTERVSELSLDYTDLVHGQTAANAQAQLDAQVSPDVVFAQKSRDRGTYAQVARVRAAAHTRAAATLYSAGNVQDAEREMKKGREETLQLNEVAGDQTITRDLDTIAPAPAAAMPAPTSEEGRNTSKRMKASAYQLDME
jgi:Ca-activated chloride channel family protein